LHSRDVFVKPGTNETKEKQKQNKIKSPQLLNLLSLNFDAVDDSVLTIMCLGFQEQSRTYQVATGMQTSATPYYFYFIFAIFYDIELCWLMLIAAACTPKPHPLSQYSPYCVAACPCVRRTC